jgi:hypothetical protein
MGHECGKDSVLHSSRRLMEQRTNHSPIKHALEHEHSINIFLNQHNAIHKTEDELTGCTVHHASGQNNSRATARGDTQPKRRMFGGDTECFHENSDQDRVTAAAKNLLHTDTTDT